MVAARQLFIRRFLIEQKDRSSVFRKKMALFPFFSFPSSSSSFGNEMDFPRKRSSDKLLQRSHSTKLFELKMEQKLLNFNNPKTIFLLLSSYQANRLFSRVICCINCARLFFICTFGKCAPFVCSKSCT